ncbi:MAG: MarR family winged helix-turn-helix transcriptional regulator [Dehalococcoidia bacterium]
MQHNNFDQIEQAIDVYAEAIRLVDPIRLELWEENELTTAQLRILFALYRTPALPLRELACKIGVTPSTTSGLVDKLVRRGLVRRAECAEDRRVVRHCLTAPGRQAAGELQRTTRNYLAGIFARLDPEVREQLTAGLRRLCDAAAEAVTDHTVAMANGRAETSEPHAAHVQAY